MAHTHDDDLPVVQGAAGIAEPDVLPVESIQPGFPPPPAGRPTAGPVTTLKKVDERLAALEVNDGNKGTVGLFTPWFAIRLALEKSGQIPRTAEEAQVAMAAMKKRQRN